MCSSDYDRYFNDKKKWMAESKRLKSLGLTWEEARPAYSSMFEGVMDATLGLYSVWVLSLEEPGLNTLKDLKLLSGFSDVVALQEGLCEEGLKALKIKTHERFSKTIRPELLRPWISRVQMSYKDSISDRAVNTVLLWMEEGALLVATQRGQSNGVSRHRI